MKDIVKQSDTAFLQKTASDLSDMKQVLSEVTRDQISSETWEDLRAKADLALSNHPAVREYALLLFDNPSGERRLVSYVVLDGSFEQGVNESDIREFLGPHVSWARVDVTIIKALPKRGDGTSDEEALRAMAQQRAQAKTHTAPTGWLETQLFHIWSELLGISDFGVEDDFFALGGHSLLAMQVLSRIYDVFGVELPLNILFDNDLTISSLAPRLKEFLPDRSGLTSAAS